MAIYDSIHSIFLKEIELYTGPIFRGYTDQTKLCSILSQTLYGVSDHCHKYKNLCLKFIQDITQRRECGRDDA